MDFEELNKVLEEYRVFVEQQYKDNLIRDGRPASGALIDSIRTEVRFDGTTYEVTMYLQDYWKYIEEGTKGRKTGNPSRKFPPVDKILSWVQVKPNLPKPGTLEEQMKYARRIAGKIMWYGTKGKPSLEDAKRTAMDEFGDRIASALGRDITYYIVKVLQE